MSNSNTKHAMKAANAARKAAALLAGELAIASKLGAAYELCGYDAQESAVNAGVAFSLRADKLSAAEEKAKEEQGQGIVNAPVPAPAVTP